MAAEIYQFPKKQPKLSVVRSIDLQHCWDRRLNNPYLNSLYKTETSYVERWYLQVTHHLRLEELDHPLINSLMNRNDYTLDLLLTCCNNDLKIQLSAVDASLAGSVFSMAADYNVGRLNKWKKKWEGLIKHRDLFYKT